MIVGRIRQDGSGGAPAGVDALVVTPRNAEAPLRITALAWVSATRLAVAVRAATDRDQIRLISVDGGPIGADRVGGNRLLGGRVLRLVSSPRADAALFAVTSGGVESPFEPELAAGLDPAIAALTYVG